MLPLATGGRTAHVLAIDYALRPVLNSMGAAHIVQGWFTLDTDITAHDDGTVTVAPAAAEALTQVVDQFSTALGHPPAPGGGELTAMAAPAPGVHVIANGAEALAVSAPAGHGGADVSALAFAEIFRLPGCSRPPSGPACGAGSARTGRAAGPGEDLRRLAEHRAGHRRPAVRDGRVEPEQARTPGVPQMVDGYPRPVDLLGVRGEEVVGGTAGPGDEGVRYGRCGHDRNSFPPACLPDDRRTRCPPSRPHTLSALTR